MHDVRLACSQVSYDSINVAIPAGVITFSPDAATVPATTFADGVWRTSVYACQTSVVFLSGTLYNLTSSITAESPATNNLVRRGHLHGLSSSSASFDSTLAADAAAFRYTGDCSTTQSMQAHSVVQAAAAAAIAPRVPLQYCSLLPPISCASRRWYNKSCLGANLPLTLPRHVSDALLPAAASQGVSWTATYAADSSDVSFWWQWGAAVYTSCGDSLSDLGVLTVDQGRCAGPPSATCAQPRSS